MKTRFLLSGDRRLSLGYSNVLLIFTPNRTPYLNIFPTVYYKEQSI